FAGSTRVIVVLPQVESEDVQISSPPVELDAGNMEVVVGHAVGRDVDDARSRSATERHRAAGIDVGGLTHIGEGSHLERIVSPEFEVLGELSAAELAVATELVGDAGEDVLMVVGVDEALSGGESG